MSTKFTACLVFESDKEIIQKYRADYKLPEKIMLQAILQAVSKHPETLTEIAAELFATKPKRGRKKKEEITESEVEAIEELAALA
jgi:hypothetical protein